MTNSTGTRTPNRVLSTQASSRRWRVIAVLLMVAALLTTVASAMGPHGWQGGRLFGAGDPPPVEEIQEHVAVKLKWALQRLDATPEQHEQIQAITFASLERLMALRGDRESMHARMANLVQSDGVDREALEALRQEKVQLVDSASREVVGAMADIFEVLTPEQRQQLMERFEHHHR